MITAPEHRPGRNDRCWCGSGRKYKTCHLNDDEAKEHDRREKARVEAERETEGHADHRCEYYRPRTHKVSAIERPDFVIAVRNLASAGPGTWLHIAGPVDLGRDQASVDAATEFLGKHGVLADFRLDPSPPLIAATQELIDRMCGRGVFAVRPSGSRLRRYGRTEVASDPVGNRHIAYLSGRGSMHGVVHLLIDATAHDAMALGVTGGLLARVWPIARVAREIVRNKLALPEPLLEQAPKLVAALVHQISQAADLLDSQGAPADVVRAQATLPYLVGLREAVSDPEGQLVGMGLEEESIEILAVQLETAADSPPWLLQLADLAGGEWDTPEGYRAWVDAARSIAEVADVLDVLAEGEGIPPSALPRETAPLDLTIGEGSDHPIVPGPTTMPANAQTGPPQGVPLPAAGPLTVFAEIDTAAHEYAGRRQVLRDRLAEILDRKEQLAQVRRELEAKLGGVATEGAQIDAQQSAATGELDAEAEAEARFRQETIVSILARGAAQLNEAAVASAPVYVVSPAGGSDAMLTKATLTVHEYEEMERRGVLEQLPVGVRAHLQEEVEEARASLREALGGRDPLPLPAVVAAAEDESGLTLSVGLPISGGDELVPGALQTAVAAAIADVLADLARSVPQIKVEAVDHERLPKGGSLLRMHFSGPPPVTADDCAQYCASLLRDAGERSIPLRAAGVLIDARVEPDLDLEA